MRCAGFREDQYCLYILDLLPSEEREPVSAHLHERCETCVNEIAAARKIWTAVGVATPDTRPPPDLRGKVLEAAGVPVRPSRWRGYAAIAAAFATLFVAVVGIGLMNQRKDAGKKGTVGSSPVIAAAPQAAVPSAVPAPAATARPDQNLQARARNPDIGMAALGAQLSHERERSRQLEAELAAARSKADESESRYLALARQNAAPGLPPPPVARNEEEELLRRVETLNARASELENEVGQYRVLLEMQQRRADRNLELANLMTSPELRVLRLRSTEKGPGAEGHAVVADGSRLIFFASQMPALPGSRTYQLWIMRGSKPAIVSAGLFTVDAHGQASLEVKDMKLIAGMTALAVTDEPAGGSPLPTGHKWLIGA
jgi:Anti-sigma-K factor rskA